MICRIINVEVRVISQAKGEADNSFRDIDNFAYHKNLLQITQLSAHCVIVAFICMQLTNHNA